MVEYGLLISELSDMFSDLVSDSLMQIKSLWDSISAITLIIIAAIAIAVYFLIRHWLVPS